MPAEITGVTKMGKQKSAILVFTVVLLLLAISILPASAQGTPKKGGSLKGERARSKCQDSGGGY